MRIRVILLYNNMLTISILPMSQNYARTLQDQDQVEHFLTKVLELDYSQLSNDIAYKIIQGEKGVDDSDTQSQTLVNTKFRDRNYKEENKRWFLREQIIQELLTLTRPENDDLISLGNGGALPRSGIKTDSQAYILIGLPASGKSSIAVSISEKFGAIIIDPDFAKRKLPEFSNYTWGATVVHDESSEIVNGFANNPKKILSVYETAIQRKYNVVVPKIGSDKYSVLKTCNTYKLAGYEVHLTLVSLFRKDATIRALHRFSETGRYVPLSLIFDGYSNDPCLNYYMLRNMKQNVISSFGAVSSDVPRGQPYKLIDFKGNNPARLYQEQPNNFKLAIS